MIVTHVAGGLGRGSNRHSGFRSVSMAVCSLSIALTLIACAPPPTQDAGGGDSTADAVTDAATLDVERTEVDESPTDTAVDLATDSPPEVSDVPLATDVRVDATGPCRDDADCDDGVFCNGVERCLPGLPRSDARGCIAQSAAPCRAGQYCDEAGDRCLDQCDALPDADGDGLNAVVCGGTDCDDTDPAVHPGAIEVCDPENKDEDCNPLTFGERDRDADGALDADCCNRDPSGAAICGDDCNDHAGQIRPGVTETCNHIDDDCDGTVDDGLQVSLYPDADADGHGRRGSTRLAGHCPGDPRFSDVADDCNDSAPSVNPAQVEICDGQDNDCDGATDEEFNTVTWYRDQDGDGAGTAAGGTQQSCTPVPGYTLLAGDCDDHDSHRAPTRIEVCDGIDNDCNGRADYRLPAGDTEDDDQDGFVDARCPGARNTDCSDSDPDTHPGALEICDARDNDCNGMVDDATQTVNWYRDLDLDGHGDPATEQRSCTPLDGRIRTGGDCDDGNANIHPGIPDGCDGFDNDCDSLFDEDATLNPFYPDADHDGYGSSTALMACIPPPGHIGRTGDCNDSVAAVNPGATEVCDAVDNNCNGTVDEGAMTLCTLSNAAATCVAGACTVAGCTAPFGDCNATVTDGCEINLSNDVSHCGTCATVCTARAHATATCASGTCGFACVSGYGDCNGNAADGCESDLSADMNNCGRCLGRCPSPLNATGACTSGRCAITCDAGYHDCNGVLTDGCESNTDVDHDNCGACGAPCANVEDLCLAGTCIRPPYISTGVDGAFHPTQDTMLPARVYNFTTIVIPTGVRVTTNGTGVIELRARGDVQIDGILDLSGGNGGDGSVSTAGCAASTRGFNGGGGATGNPLAPGAAGLYGVCALPGGGGQGGNGTGGGSFLASGCGQGGTYGGGSGGSAYRFGGGGGGGFAGGGGGGGANGGSGGGAGASAGSDTGGAGGGPMAGGAGGGGSLAGLLAVYHGSSGWNNRCAGWGGGGAGGSIGETAAMDLPVATTFRPGSGGGAGGAGDCPGGPGGGGGGGGALRVTSYTRIVITGQVLAAGGAGGDGRYGNAGDSGAGGGGSGGVIYLVAPAVQTASTAVLSVAGGAPGTGAAGCGGHGGLGGRGRIRISVRTDPRQCSLAGTFTPVLVSACTASVTGGTPDRVFIAEYPN